MTFSETAKHPCAAATESIYFLDRGGVGNQLSDNPDFNGASAYPSNQGYRVTFTGQNFPIKTPPDNLNTDADRAPAFGQLRRERSRPDQRSGHFLSQTNKNSMLQEYSLSVQRQLDKQTVLTVAWMGTKQDHLYNSVAYTAPQLGTGYQFFDSGPGVTTNRGLSVVEDEDNGTGHYNGLQSKVERRMSNGLQLIGTYTWSHAQDNSTGPWSPTGGNGTVYTTAAGPQFNLNRGNTGDDQRHAFTFAGIWDIPVGRGRQFGGNMNRGIDEAVGGWELDPFIYLRHRHAHRLLRQQFLGRRFQPSRPGRRSALRNYEEERRSLPVQRSGVRHSSHQCVRNLRSSWNRLPQ